MIVLLPGWLPVEQIVDIESLEGFLDQYYRADRYRERGEEYARVLTASYKKDFEKDGYVMISRFDSVTGREVVFCPAYIHGSVEQTTTDPHGQKWMVVNSEKL